MSFSASFSAFRKDRQQAIHAPQQMKTARLYMALIAALSGGIRRAIEEALQRMLSSS